MTKEEKEILLKDLCSRLPYEIKGKTAAGEVNPLIRRGQADYDIITSIKIIIEKHGWRPYLFPLSSMTEEQKNECFNGTPLEIDKYGDVAVKDDLFGNSLYTDLEIYLEVINWLLKNHFDIYGLIKKGFAIDATNLNIY